MSPVDEKFQLPVSIVEADAICAGPKIIGPRLIRRIPSV